MKRLLLTLLVVASIGFLTTGKVSAQIGVQAGSISPVGDWSEFWGLGAGGKVFYKRALNDRILLGGSVGLFIAQGRKVDPFLSKIFRYKTLPILATLDY